MDDKDGNAGGRRTFLKNLSAIAGGAPLANARFISVSAGGAAVAISTSTGAAETPSNGAPTVGYICFSQGEAAFVEKLVDVMCPADELTPNGTDCGLATYMDRQLAGDFGRGAKRYSRGPWQQGKPQQGFQLPMTPEQFFKAGLEVVSQSCVT